MASSKIRRVQPIPKHVQDGNYTPPEFGSAGYGFSICNPNCSKGIQYKEIECDLSDATVLYSKLANKNIQQQFEIDRLKELIGELDKGANVNKEDESLERILEADFKGLPKHKSLTRYNIAIEGQAF
jgi:hypothetical protein